MGFLQLVVVPADMTGVALRPPGLMSHLKCEMKSLRRKYDRLRRQDWGGPPAFEIRMGFLQRGVSRDDTSGMLYCANPAESATITPFRI